MKTVLIASFLICVGVASAISQSDWDTDRDSPPSVSNLKPLPKPTKINPFHFIFYQKCLPDSNGTVGYTGQYTFDIFAEFGLISFDCDVADTLATVKLRRYYRGAEKAKLWFPMIPFTLQIILGTDTARFHLDLSTGLCQYVKQSKLLMFDTTKEIPSDLLYIQFVNLSPSNPKIFLKEITEKFGAAIQKVVLDPGYYPCLSGSWLRKKAIGRHKVVNVTGLGYFIFIRVTDSTQYEAVADWMGQRQKEEFKKGVSKFSFNQKEK